MANPSDPVHDDRGDIKRIRVFVLGPGDYPLAPPIDIDDGDVLAAIQQLIADDQRLPHVHHSYVRVMRALMRSGVANLQRVIGKGLLAIQNDGKLAPKRKDSGEAIAALIANDVQ